MIIKVEFLHGQYRGGLNNLEFPPHPARLYSAMVAAYHDGEGTNAERKLLLAMQGKSPTITSPQPCERTNVNFFVPTNAMGIREKASLSGPVPTNKKSRSFPSAYVDEPVYYRWDIADSHRKSAETLMARVPTLGTSASMCIATVVDEAPEPKLVPASAGTNSLRCPHEDYLNDLEAVHDLNMQSLAETGMRKAKPRRRLVAYGSPSERDAVGGEFDDMIAIRLVGRRQDYLHGPLMARMVRSALMSVISDPIPPIISGHNANGSQLRDSHISLVPLPFCDHKHGDGHIMGVGLLLPKTLMPIDRLTVCQGLSRLDHVGEFTVEQFDESWSLRVNRYKQAATTWTTVTPIEINYPRKNRSVDEMVKVACEQAGLPRPCNVIYSRRSWINGVRDAQALRCERGYLTHALISFSCPVSGPVSIGRGRYLGFGLCLPNRSER